MVVKIPSKFDLQRFCRWVVWVGRRVALWWAFGWFGVGLGYQED